MNNNQHIIILIDCSYSMENILKEVVKGLNNFLEKIKIQYKNYPINIFLTVASFSNNLKYIVEYKNINLINFFDENDFITWGSTALYDSICNIILKFQNNNNTNLYIITDGDDNMSKTYTKEQTNELCDMAIQSGLWKIIHCHTDINILNIPTIKYDINDISNIFNMLTI